MGLRELTLSLVIGYWSLVICRLSLAAEVASPLEPAEAQKAFQLADASLKIELAAAEPEVVDPVAIRFDEDGRMWVAEMRDYPLGVPSSPISRIRVLEDKDGDGRFETATTFADKLLFVTGLQPWKGGVFVTLSGRLAYMKDTDGDGRADLDETWFEGFAELNSQLRANHPRLALDNWIYVANGLRGGKVVNRKLMETTPLDISGMDFRFDPLTGKYERVSGNGQFGLCFDDWGNRFTCSNRNPVRHVVIEDRYLKANPAVTVPAVMSDVAAWGEQSRIFPISRAWTTSNLHAGQFTAACGVYIYRGDLLPPEFKGNVFTCDPTGNLIHREIMQLAGPTFTSKAAYEGKEFLCSPDEWFRPVNMELGPDGALYVVDMYRCVIEHPDFVPDELKRRPDQRLGDDRGRIWRVVPNVGPSRREGLDSRMRPALSKAASEDLVPSLEHPNAWQRETAQRLLLERERPKIGEQVAKLVTSSKLPQGRLHAVASMQAIGELNESKIAAALRAEEDSHVRRLLILLMGSTEDSTYDREARFEVIRPHLVDPDPAVRFTARLTAAYRNLNSSKEGIDKTHQQEVKDADDPWQRAAMRMFLAQFWRANPAFDLILNGKANEPPNDGLRIFVRELCEMEAGPEMLLKGTFYTGLLARTGSRTLAIAGLQGALRGLARNKVPPTDRQPMTELRILRSYLLDIVRDEKEDLSLRRDAIDIVGYLPESAIDIVSLTARNRDQAIRLAAIGALVRQPGIEHWPPLLAGFASYTPPIRRAVIEGLLTNSDRMTLLLDAIEAGKIKPIELDLQQAKRLTTHKDSAIKERAAKLFEAATPADRAKALAEYQPVLQMAGDAKHGQAIFEKNCAVCHRIAGIGVNVAPDISDSRTKKPEQLLADILQPNRAIDNNYLGYTVRLLDGTVLTGILTTETATSITLRQQGGKEAVLARSEIDELKSSGVSLMPEGLERQIPLQEMADLLSFIKNWRYLDGRTPLSQ